MKRVLLLLMLGFLIAGGTIAILYQEGMGGKLVPDAETSVSSEASVSDDATAKEASETKVNVVNNDLFEFEAQDTVDTTGKEDSSPEDIDEIIEDVKNDTESEATEVTVEETTAAEEQTADAGENTEQTESAKAPEEGSEVSDLFEGVGEEPLPEGAKPGDPSIGEVLGDTAEAEAAAAEAEAAAAEAAEKKAKKEAKAPFYSVKVVGMDGGLTIHKTPTEKNDSIGSVDNGTVGYLIEKGSGNRSLCFIDNQIGYLSNKYIELTEIAIDDYPDLLLDVTAEEVGIDVTPYLEQE